MKYAIFESGGKQYKAVEGELVVVDRLAANPGSELKLDKILLMVEDDSITVGTPTIDGKSVLATVKGHIKGPKLTVFKYRPKKRIRVKTGHRQTYTHLMIEQVGDKKSVKEPVAEKVVVEKPVSKSSKEKASTTTKKSSTTEKKASTAAKKSSTTTKKSSTAAKKTATPAKKTSTTKKKSTSTKKTTTTTKKSSSSASSEKKPADKKSTNKTEKA